MEDSANTSFIAVMYSVRVSCFLFMDEDALCSRMEPGGDSFAAWVLSWYPVVPQLSFWWHPDFAGDCIGGSPAMRKLESWWCIFYKSKLTLSSTNLPQANFQGESIQQCGPGQIWNKRCHCKHRGLPKAVSPAQRFEKSLISNRVNSSGALSSSGSVYVIFSVIGSV
jgi:hypothetical protein